MGISYYIKMIVIFLELFNLNLIRIKTVKSKFAVVDENCSQSDKTILQ